MNGSSINLNRKRENFFPVQYRRENTLTPMILRALPTNALVGFFFYLLRAGGTGSNPMFPFVNRINIAPEQMQKKVKISHVTGLTETKREVVEFRVFFREPHKFVKLGAKTPKGALLVGPPGCGKTLLAKAVAGKADVPFFSQTSWSCFSVWAPPE